VVNDFDACLKQETAKDVRIDDNKIESIRAVAKKKHISTNKLNTKEDALAKISLLYDILREHLEALALEEGYKIYNHECYTPFIKEILKKSDEGDTFDKLRQTRNRINYYGMDVNEAEAEKLVKQLEELIVEFSK
jgi:hypothetical protein